jgi:tight adherence protein B
MNVVLLAALSGPLARIGVAAIVVIAVGALAATILTSFGREVSVATRLSDYEQNTGHSYTFEKGAASHVDTDFLQSAVNATGRLAGRTGLLEHVEGLLERAEVPLRPAEGLFFTAAGVFVVSALVLFLTPSPAFVLIAGPLVAIVPYVLLRRKANKRLAFFEQSLPDTLVLLSGSLRAGFSFMQALEAIASETQEPMRSELRRVFNEARLGRPVEDALGDSAERMSSADLGWAVIAIRIQREVGGNLAELLDTVAETMMERDRLRREVRALTAEGRFSSYVLGIFPIAFAGVLYAIRPTYIGLLFSSIGGDIAVGIAGVMSLFGFWWLMQIVKIEV